MANEMPVPPQQPIVTFFDPNKNDQGLVEYWSVERANDTPIDVGTPHPNTRDYPNFRLGLQAAVENEDGWVRRVWVTDETSPDWFNYEIKFAAEANAFPTYIRQYRIDKKIYEPLTKGSALGAVFLLRLLTAGSGYVPGTLPTVTFSGGGGSGATGHAIVNLDGTIADVVIDTGGSGYTTVPTATIEDPPIGVTATAEAEIQPQTAVLIAEQAEEFPKDSEFFGLFFNVTRVYETLPGPTLESTEIEEDGKTKTTSHTRDVASSVTTSETAASPGNWVKTTKKETGNLYVAERVVETRPLPGNAIPFTRLDDDGAVVTGSRTLELGANIVTEETLVSTTWTRTFKKEVTDKVSWEVTESRVLPGPLKVGEQTGKWGREILITQKVVYGTAIDEGYLIKESKVDLIEGSNIAAIKTTVYFPGNLYGVALDGQDYDPRLDTVIPYVEKLQPMSYGIGVNREDITPVDYEHAHVRTIDPATVQAVLDDYVFRYPGRINVDMPDMLTRVDAVIESSTSDGADQEVGANDFTATSGSISQSLTAQAQASANILPEAYPTVKQFWGNNIPCEHLHFFLANPVTQSDVLTKLNDLLFPDTVSDWPKFNPEIVTLVMTGGRVSAQSKAHSQGSLATSDNFSTSTSTAGGGVGYSEERGLTIKTLRISPTIHAELTVYGDVYGTENVTTTAYAEAAGLGPLETQTTGPLSVVATVTPSTIPATIGDTAWPTSGLYLYRTDPHPYRYGYIEFHCVVVDAADFPNVP